MNSGHEQTPRRVLHVMNSLERSGMEMMLLSSYGEWRRLGYQCDVLATAREIGPLADEMRAAGYRVYHIPFRSNFRFLPRVWFVRDVYRLCRSGYDVVHIHTETGPPVYSLLAKLAGVRRIALTPHNTFRFEGLLRVRKRFERAFARMLGGRFGMISEGVKHCEWDRFRNNGVRISNWIDTSRFKPPTDEQRDAARRSLGLEPDDFVIVSVGNCNAFKNHEAIFRAIPLLPFHCAYLHVGREDTEQSERKLATDLKIDDEVRFVGSQPDPLSFLWAADVFAMPSLMEGLSIAAIEAIAAGSTALFSDNPGLTEVAAATTGTVLTSTTPQSVADGLKQVAAIDRRQRRAQSVADSNMIRERFSVAQGVRSITERLYA